MDRRIDKLADALIDVPSLCNDAHVFSLCIGRLHAADIGQFKAAVFLDLGNHTSKGVAVGFQKDAVLILFSSKVSNHSAFYGPAGRNPQSGKLL